MAYNKNSWQDGDIITAEKLNHMEDGIEAAGGLNNDVKTALLQIAEKVAYIDEHGQDYYDDLYDALYPSASLVSISAVYTQSGTVYPTTSLSALKDDLVVTAYYDDTSSEAVPAADYMLSGALTVGTSVITASYNGKTATFIVTVSAVPTVSSISAVYTQSGTVYETDSLDSLKSDLVVTATYSDSSTATVPSADYTLSGTLTAGTSTITVTYEEKTTSFNVMVTAVLWLYKDGDECTSLTGGYTTTGFNVNASRITRTKETDHMSMVANATFSNSTAASYSTANKIDFTGYTKLVVKANFKLDSGTMNAWLYFSTTLAEATSQNGAYGSSYKRAFVGLTDSGNIRTAEIDIETAMGALLTGEYYMSWNLNGWNNAPVGSFAKIYEIYMK